MHQLRTTDISIHHRDFKTYSNNSSSSSHSLSTSLSITLLRSLLRRDSSLLLGPDMEGHRCQTRWMRRMLYRPKQTRGRPIIIETFAEVAFRILMWQACWQPSCSSFLPARVAAKEQRCSLRVCLSAGLDRETLLWNTLRLARVASGSHL
jgi:hypothetical protein